MGEALVIIIDGAVFSAEREVEEVTAAVWIERIVPNPNFELGGTPTPKLGDGMARKLPLEDVGCAMIVMMDAAWR